ncbi:hypothetical protein ACJJTC_013221 [Scirpophaga incertulas]
MFVLRSGDPLRKHPQMETYIEECSSQTLFVALLYCYGVIGYKDDILSGEWFRYMKLIWFQSFTWSGDDSLYYSGTIVQRVDANWTLRFAVAWVVLPRVNHPSLLSGLHHEPSLPHSRI